MKSHPQSLTSSKKWYPYFKGGTFRRWYGNKEYVVDYQYDGIRVKAGDRNPSIYFKDNINWSKISSGYFSARCGEIGALYDDAACQCSVFNFQDYNYILGVLNSKYAQQILWSKSQTFNYISSEVSKIPIKMEVTCRSNIETTVQVNIAISKQDWDAHETSWDFEENELIRMQEHCEELGRNPHLMEDCYHCYQEEWTEKFNQLHENEEELNRQFIEIYGLEDELTPDVPLDEITILQQGEITIE